MKKCEYELDATNAALGMRTHGKTKADLLATLPPRERTARDPKAETLHSILDDIYSRKDIAAYPYFHYRGLVCLTKAQGVAVNAPFHAVADEILACQGKHGTEKTDALGECILAAVERRL
ncbi:hypothetical protein ACFFGH_33940 [Lysobacter korlensis]|uniref:Uncharacterized protein n=1 Tax=Lysobacter korlensis TaxID=553636 RepID=A0ABV6S1D3_9GAMM